MSFLLDTNVVSEWTRPRPDQGVVTFLETTDEESLFLSVITLAELRRGAERLASGRRRTTLTNWLETELIPRFEGRILDIDRNVAAAWGRSMVQAERRGGTPGVMDAWIAAVAVVHDLTVVTRDLVGFRLLLDRIFNPWSVPGTTG